MKTKISLLLAVLISAALMITGCGSKDAQPEKADETVAANEAETKAAVETEETSSDGIDDAWKGLYTDCIIDALGEDSDSLMTTFALVRIDPDNVPELLVNTGSHAGMTFYWVKDGELRSEVLGLSNGEFLYSENDGCFYYEYNAQGTSAALYSFDGESVTLVNQADSYYDEYYVDKEPADKAAFENALSSMKAGCPDGATFERSDDMISLIENY